MVDLHLEDFILEATKNAISILWPIIAPYVYMAIATGLILFIIKKISYQVNILTGSTQREAKRKANKFRDLIDLISTFIGIIKK
jgi:hypothetical protein